MCYKIYGESSQCQRIVWLPEKILNVEYSSLPEINGYIVQTVKLTPDDTDIEPLDYLEVWKVKDGVIFHGTCNHELPYDDEFSCKEGQSAVFSSKVYWVSYDDLEYQIIEKIPYGRSGECPWGVLQGTCDMKVILSIIKGKKPVCMRKFHAKG